MEGKHIRKNIIFIFVMLITAVIVYAASLGSVLELEYSNGNVVTINDTIITGTTIPCGNVSGASYNVCTGTGAAGEGNETDRVDAVVATNCTGQTVAMFYPNGTGICEADDTGAGGTGYNSTTINTTVLIDSGGNLTINYSWWQSVWATLTSVFTEVNTLNTSLQSQFGTADQNQNTSILSFLHTADTNLNTTRDSILSTTNTSLIDRITLANASSTAYADANDDDTTYNNESFALPELSNNTVNVNITVSGNINIAGNMTFGRWYILWNSSDFCMANNKTAYATMNCIQD